MAKLKSVVSSKIIRIQLIKIHSSKTKNVKLKKEKMIRVLRILKSILPILRPYILVSGKGVTVKNPMTIDVAAR